ncbi:uncharacterized protein [Miscanthus floridulus]|uniref:uncharacterized protein n=1 Tax=Miscanthus floridulus TaxID=154761 RepID=UPI00345845A3
MQAAAAAQPTAAEVRGPGPADPLEGRNVRALPAAAGWRSEARGSSVRLRRDLEDESGSSAVVSAAEETLVAAVADLDAVAEFPSLLRARAFLAVAQAATSLLAVFLRCSGIDPDEPHQKGVCCHVPAIAQPIFVFLFQLIPTAPKSKQIDSASRIDSYNSSSECGNKVGVQQCSSVINYNNISTGCWAQTYANFDAGVWLLGTVMCFWTGFSYVV